MKKEKMTMSLNEMICEKYNDLQQHLDDGQGRLYDTYELYFGGEGEGKGKGEGAPAEVHPENTFDMLVKVFRDMEQFISDTNNFLDLL